MINFNFDDLATDKGAKKIAQLFQRAGAPVIQTEADSRIRRAASVSYREIHFTHADGQRTSIRITKSGDIGQVLVNNSVIPIKNQSDVVKAVGEISDRLESGRAKFQAKMARTKVELPKGIKTAAPKIEQQLQEESERLDKLIDEKSAHLADLKAKLGPVMDSASVGIILTDDVSEALKLSESINGALLDGVDYGAAKAALSAALDVVENNWPINMADGNVQQAEAEQNAAKSFRSALAVLDDAEPYQPEDNSEDQELDDPDSQASLFDGSYVDGPKSSDIDKNSSAKVQDGEIASIDESGDLDIEPLPEQALTLDSVTLSSDADNLSSSLEAISSEEWDTIPINEIISALSSSGYSAVTDTGELWTGEVDDSSGSYTFDLLKDGALAMEQLRLQWELMPSGKYQIAAFAS